MIAKQAYNQKLCKPKAYLRAKWMCWKLILSGDEMAAQLITTVYNMQLGVSENEMPISTKGKS